MKDQEKVSKEEDYLIKAVFLLHHFGSGFFWILLSPFVFTNYFFIWWSWGMILYFGVWNYFVFVFFKEKRVFPLIGLTLVYNGPFCVMLLYGIFINVPFIDPTGFYQVFPMYFLIYLAFNFGIVILHSLKKEQVTLKKELKEKELDTAGMTFKNFLKIFHGKFLILIASSIPFVILSSILIVIFPSPFYKPGYLGPITIIWVIELIFIHAIIMIYGYRIFRPHEKVTETCTG